MKKAIILFVTCLTMQLNAQVGSTATDFSGTDTHGNPINLFDILDNGQHVVLDFFFTTCTPCIFYTPQVNAAYEKYGCNTGEVYFLSVDFNDTDAEVLAYENEHDIEYPAISGLDGGGNSIVSQYGIQGFPTFYTIHPNREIVAVIDPPTVVVFDFYFNQLGINESVCNSGVEEFQTSNDFGLYPVPAVSDFVTVDLRQSFFGDAAYEIIDAMGRTVKKASIEMFGSSLALPIGDLSSGQYMMKIKPNGSAISYAKTFVR